MQREAIITLDFDSFDPVRAGDATTLRKFTVRLGSKDSAPLDRVQWPFRGHVFMPPQRDALPWDDWWLESVIIHGEENLLSNIPLVQLLGHPIALTTAPTGSAIELGARNLGTEARRLRVSLRGRTLT